MMPETKSGPDPSEVEAFLGELRAFRETLPDHQKSLLDALFSAAIGRRENDDLEAYWAEGGHAGPPCITSSPWEATWHDYDRDRTFYTYSSG